jgi:hypothetical protein
LDNWAKRWGTSAGILLASLTEEDALFAHLRKIFVVEDEEKQEYFFRFYDPRVLRGFLPTCSAEQLDQFFGPIDQLTLEGEQGAEVLQFRTEVGKLVATNANLTATMDEAYRKSVV